MIKVTDVNTKKPQTCIGCGEKRGVSQVLIESNYMCASFPLCKECVEVLKKACQNNLQGIK